VKITLLINEETNVITMVYCATCKSLGAVTTPSGGRGECKTCNGKGIITPHPLEGAQITNKPTK
jgi:DnaJ-class molecular chaperone